MPSSGLSSDRVDRREIRVHGIGLHDPWDVLGSPTIAEGSPNVGSYSFVALRTSARSFVWSRITRGSTVLWYALLPFTLINVAGYMVGADSPTSRHRWYRFIVVLAGALLTAVSLLWLVAIVDTVASHIRWWVLWQSFRWTLLFVVVGSLVTSTIVRFLRTRASANEEGVGVPDRISAFSLTANLVAIAVAVLSIFVVHPFTLCDRQLSEADCASSIRSGAIIPPPDLFRELLLNGIAVSFGILLVATLVLIFWPGPNRSARRSEYTGVLVCGIAIGLAGMYLASIRNAFAWLSAYFDLVVPLLPQGITFFGPPTYVDGQNHIRWSFVLEADNGRDFVVNPPSLVGPYLFIGFGLLALIIFLSALFEWLQNRDRHVAAAHADYPSSPRSWLVQVAKTWSRRGLLDTLSTRFTFVLPIFIVVWIGSIVYLEMIFRDVQYHPRWARFGANITHVLSAAAFLFLLSFVSRRVRQRGSLFFDVAGLWPARFHPLSAPPYGAVVVGELQRELEAALDRGGVRLVGHSQGSVLSFEAAGRLPVTTRRDFALITCGSPLQRLYGQFFPAFFGSERFRALAGRIKWTNVYRDTDPIASQVPYASNSRILEPTANDSRKLLKHGEYWTDQAVMAAIDD